MKIGQWVSNCEFRKMLLESYQLFKKKRIGEVGEYTY